MSQHEEWAKQAQTFIEGQATKELTVQEEYKRRRQLEEDLLKKKALSSLR